MIQQDDISKKLWENKQILIYGRGKVQEDFEYVFEQVRVSGYIGNHDHSVNNTAIPLIEIQQGKHFVIVCSENLQKADRQLTDIGLRYREDFVHVEDMLHILDVDWNEPWDNKKLIIWGIGNTCEDLLRLSEIHGYKGDIKFFLDKNAKPEQVFYGKSVFGLDSLDRKEPEDLLIVANGFYDEIKEQLLGSGYVENVDFTNFFQFHMYLKRYTARPSEMMKKVLYARQIDAPFCYAPFTTAFLSDVMECCCEAMVKNSIGAVDRADLSSVWNSVSARIFRLSIINKTFCFCKWENCSNFSKEPKEDHGRFDINISAGEYPKRLQINIDETCNLYCGSCRNSICAATGEKLDHHQKVADYLIKSGWLENVENVLIAGYGEVFASQVYKKLLETTKQIGRKKITVLSNLLLFSEENWSYLDGKYEYIEFQVSIDAAKKETYEKLRRGGNWENLQKKLQFLSYLRKSGKVHYVMLNMVVQRDNFKEMEQFLEMTYRYGFDKAYYQKMYDLGSFQNKGDYLYRAMLTEEGRPIEELQLYIDKIKENPKADISLFG